MNPKLSKDDAFEVSDSTDWLQTPLRSLAAVDSALRCQVCKDFYTTPMITSCSHTFCSLCIRRCLSNDGRCPACRAQDQELKLRFNGAMEDLVEAFKNARPEVMEYAKRPVVVEGATSPKRSREESYLEEDEGPLRKRTRQSRRTPSKHKVVVLDSDLDDEDYVPEEGFVQCPICQKDVKTEAINAHIDRNCVDEPTSKFSKISIQPSSSSATSQKPVKQPDRLAALNYGMVKDNALRKKLTDLGISAAGSRQLMERRYTEWVTLWNANCDATKPKTKGELKRDLEVWEKTQGGRASASNMGAQIRDKDFDGVAWSSKHDDSFRQLIANARRKPAVKASLPESKSDQLDGAASHSAGTGVASSNQVGVHTEMGDDGFGDGAEQLAEEFAESGGQDPSPRKGRRFFDENIDPQSSAAPPSSQYSSSMPIQGKDAGISSNIATIRPVQP